MPSKRAHKNARAAGRRAVWNTMRLEGIDPKEPWQDALLKAYANRWMRDDWALYEQVRKDYLNAARNGNRGDAVLPDSGRDSVGAVLPAGVDDDALEAAGGS